MTFFLGKGSHSQDAGADFINKFKSSNAEKKLSDWLIQVV